MRRIKAEQLGLPYASAKGARKNGTPMKKYKIQRIVKWH
jgi:hypothetical protein